MLYCPNCVKHKKPYLHPWNNLPQNAAQTSSPPWRAQRPAESTQRQEKAVLMGPFPWATGQRDKAASAKRLYTHAGASAHHAGCAPYVGWRAVPGADEHL